MASALEDVADVPALDETGGVGEVDDPFAEGHRVLDRECVGGEVGGQLVVPPRDGENDLRVRRDLAVCVPAVDLDHVEPGVLAALEHVVAHDEGGAVPVVVPVPVGDARVGVHRPEDGRRRPVGRDDAEVVVARARVVERVAVGIGGGRSLGQVTGDEVWLDRLPRDRVHEVVVVVVRAEPELQQPALVRDDVRLPRPPRAAPGLGAVLVAGLGAHAAALRVTPPDHGIARDGTVAVIRAGEVAAEGGEARDLGVDRAEDDVRFRDRLGRLYGLGGRLARRAAAAQGDPSRDADRDDAGNRQGHRAPDEDLLLPPLPPQLALRQPLGRFRVARAGPVGHSSKLCGNRRSSCSERVRALA